jgi:hypothetical protein
LYIKKLWDYVCGHWVPGNPHLSTISRHGFLEIQERCRFLVPIPEDFYRVPLERYPIPWPPSFSPPHGKNHSDSQEILSPKSDIENCMGGLTPLTPSQFGLWGRYTEKQVGAGAFPFSGRNSACGLLPLARKAVSINTLSVLNGYLAKGRYHAVLGSFPIAILYSFFVMHYVSSLTAVAVKG